MLSLSQGTLKVDAGSRNLLRGQNILVAVDNSCEGGIILSELRMNFGHNPFGLGSSRSIEEFIHHSFLHPLHHWKRTSHRRAQWGRAEPVAMRTISCVAEEIGGGRRVVVEG